MMVFLKRITKIAWQGISRNKGLSFQVFFIMAIAVFALSSLFIFRDFSLFLIEQVKKKVDVSIYFKKNVAEEQILLVKNEVAKLSKEIESVDYVSEEKAKEIFIERHKNDQLYLSALEEVGDNPFLPSLEVKAKSPLFYAQISQFISEGPFRDLVARISYSENKKVIDRLYRLTSDIQKAGVVFIVFLAGLVFLINFNTIKLTIFAYRDEISTMRLVGAPSWFIRGPFLIQGVIYGLASILVIDIFFGLVSVFLSPDFQEWFFGFDFQNYFYGKFWLILFIQIISVLILGVVSSLLAVRKYLKI